jgi:Fe2+ transport system protein B
MKSLDIDVAEKKVRMEESTKKARYKKQQLKQAEVKARMCKDAHTKACTQLKEEKAHQEKMHLKELQAYNDQYFKHRADEQKVHVNRTRRLDCIRPDPRWGTWLCWYVMWLSNHQLYQPLIC